MLAWAKCSFFEALDLLGHLPGAFGLVVVIQRLEVPFQILKYLEDLVSAPTRPTARNEAAIALYSSLDFRRLGFGTFV